REGSAKALKTKNFARIIGDKGEPKPPWLAKKEVSNNAIKAHEKREIAYPDLLQEGDIVEMTLGYYLVNPKMLESLGLQDSDVATKFHQYKKVRVEVKE
ncbi:MAG: multiheme c-type cytochrome, partial [Sulfurovum sp.]